MTEKYIFIEAFGEKQEQSLLVKAGRDEKALMSASFDQILKLFYPKRVKVSIVDKNDSGDIQKSEDQSMGLGNILELHITNRKKLSVAKKIAMRIENSGDLESLCNRGLNNSKTLERKISESPEKFKYVFV